MLLAKESAVLDDQPSIDRIGLGLRLEMKSRHRLKGKTEQIPPQGGMNQN